MSPPAIFRWFLYNEFYHNYWVYLLFVFHLITQSFDMNTWLGTNVISCAVSILKFGPLSLMARELNFRYGILLVKNGLGLLQQVLFSILLEWNLLGFVSLDSCVSIEVKNNASCPLIYLMELSVKNMEYFYLLCCN